MSGTTRWSLPDGGNFYPAEVCALAMKILPIDQERAKYSKGDIEYEFLWSITEAAMYFHMNSGNSGGNQRQIAASPRELTQTVSQVARRSGLPERTVRQHIQRGILHARKVGRPWLINADDADAYVAAHRSRI